MRKAVPITAFSVAALAGVIGTDNADLITSLLHLAAKEESGALAAWLALIAVAVVFWQVRRLRTTITAVHQNVEVMAEGVDRNNTNIETIIAALRETRLPRAAQALLDRAKLKKDKGA